SSAFTVAPQWVTARFSTQSWTEGRSRQIALGPVEVNQVSAPTRYPSWIQGPSVLLPQGTPSWGGGPGCHAVSTSQVHHAVASSVLRSAICLLVSIPGGSV